MIRQMGRALSRTRARSRSMSMTRGSIRSQGNDEHRAKKRESALSTSKARESSQRSNDSDNDDLSIEDFTLSGTGFDLDFSEDGLSASPHGPEQSRNLSSHLQSHTRSISPSISLASNSQLMLDSKLESKQEKEDRRGRVRRTKSSASQGTRSVRTTGSARSNDSNEDEKKKKRTADRSRSLQRDEDNKLYEANDSPKTDRSRSKSRDANRNKMRRDVSQSRDSTEMQADGKKRKSKMEKILQLQEKNQRYKEEFRKVQKDRKSLKDEIANRKEEAICLAKEIDSHIAATTILKEKLSNALHELALAKENQRNVGNGSTSNNKEIEKLNKRINELLEQKARDEDFMHEIKDQIKFQMELVEGLQDENEKLRLQNDNLSNSEKNFVQLNIEIDRLKSELDITVQHATDMVKEREDAISDLLKENDEMKRIVSFQHNSTADDSSSETLLQLKRELANASAALEESQDRNVALEEEIESLVQKNDDIDAEQLRLRDELEGWQEKAAAAQLTVSLIEGNATKAQRRTGELEHKLSELEKKYKEEQAEVELQHRTALEAIEKAAFEKAMAIAETKSKAPPNPQEMMLHAAVANQQRKQAEAARGSWIGGFRLGASGDSDDGLSAEQKRIKELEASNLEKEKEINRLLSELVVVRSTNSDTNYKNKKTIAQLSSDNTEFRLKIQALERELGVPSSLDTGFPDLLSTSSNSSSG